MARSSLPKLPHWSKIVRSNPAAYERHVFSTEPLRSPADAAALLRPALQREEVEVFVVMALDAQHRVIAVQRVTSGILNSSLVAPRETFRLAIVLGAAAIIVAHNHPSGRIEPSNDDIKTTEQLAAAGLVLDIPLFDHIIIGAGDRFTSFAMAGLL